MENTENILGLGTSLSVTNPFPAPQLKTEVDKLKYLCLNFDPYGHKQSETITRLLSEFHLNTEIQDPFTITNKLLVLLDKAQLEESSITH